MVEIVAIAVIVVAVIEANPVILSQNSLRLRITETGTVIGIETEIETGKGTGTKTEIETVDGRRIEIEMMTATIEMRMVGEVNDIAVGRERMTMTKIADDDTSIEIRGRTRNP